jgi:glucose/arabinose dehydrogenase
MGTAGSSTTAGSGGSNPGNEGGAGGAGEPEPVVPLLPGVVTTTAIQLAAGDPATLLQAEVIATGLTDATDMAFLPNGDAVVTLRGGDVKVLTTQGTTISAGSVEVESTYGEHGLLGVIASPDFETSHKLFIYYTRTDANGGTAANRAAVASIPLVNNALGQPTNIVTGFAAPANLVGGALALSPDKKKLYIGVGDSGGGGTNYYATCLTNPNGKILRVNLDGSVPSDNPLSQLTMVTACGASATSMPSGLAAPRKEIWAWGLRNPWTIWTDPKTGNLWVGDVGANLNEEIDIVPGPGHFGWPYREGNQGMANMCEGITPSKTCTEPTYVCKATAANTAGCQSIIGGAIVSSCHWPASLRDRYYFGDWVRGFVGSLAVNPAHTAATGPHTVLATMDAPTRFKLGPEGSLYVVSEQTNAVYRITPKAPLDCN